MNLNIFKSFVLIFLSRHNSPLGTRSSSLFRCHDHTDTPQSVGLPWTCDQPQAETSTLKHTTFTTDSHALEGIRTRNPRKRKATDPRPLESADCGLSMIIFHCMPYLLTYLITPSSRVLLEKLTGFQLFKKFPAFYGTRRFITAVTRSRHLSFS